MPVLRARKTAWDAAARYTVYRVVATAKVKKKIGRAFFTTLRRIHAAGGGPGGCLSSQVWSLAASERAIAGAENPQRSATLAGYQNEQTRRRVFCS
jgi:hypothetical protein